MSITSSSVRPPRVRLLSGLGLMLRDAGLSVANVLRRARLPDDLFARQGATVERAEYFALWQAICAEADDPLFPLHFGASIKVETFDPMLFAALCSQDLRQAIERMARYKALLGVQRFEALETSDGVRIAVIWPGLLEALPTSLIMTELVFITSFCRIALRAEISPLRVFIADPLPRLDAFAAFFGCPVESQGPDHGMWFSCELMTRPFLTANAAAWSHFDPHFRIRLADSGAAASSADRVRVALLEMLPGSRPRIDDVCSRLGVSRRTLQRRLRDEALTFQDVLDATRTELAELYLTQSDLPHAEIAYLLGFEETNSFYRAYHGWTGSTPEQRRRVASG